MLRQHQQYPLEQSYWPSSALSVTHVLEGVMRSDSEIIRITTQSIETSDGAQFIAPRVNHHQHAEICENAYLQTRRYCSTDS